MFSPRVTIAQGLFLYIWCATDFVYSFTLAGVSLSFKMFFTKINKKERKFSNKI